MTIGLFGSEDKSKTTSMCAQYCFIRFLVFTLVSSNYILLNEMSVISLSVRIGIWWQQQKRDVKMKNQDCVAAKEQNCPFNREWTSASRFLMVGNMKSQTSVDTSAVTKLQNA